MSTQTTVVAQQIRIKQWAQQVQDCQNRPVGMKVDDWCNANGITKADYYYRLRRVREFCLDSFSQENRFVELSMPAQASTFTQFSQNPAAVIHLPNGISVDLQNGISDDILKTLMGAPAYVK